MSEDKKVIISMVGVSKQTPQGKQIIKNIYLSFYYGAKIGIIGLNGSGKSTVMKIIAGLDQSFQGDVVFSPGYSIGYLSQEPELDHSKTVKEIVRVLKPGGIFFTTVWGLKTQGYGTGKRLEENTYSEISSGPCKDMGVAHFFNEKELQSYCLLL